MDPSSAPAPIADGAPAPTADGAPAPTATPDLPPGFRWPDGVRAAAMFTFDIDAEAVMLIDHPETADYPDVTTESVLVDAMSAKFVLRPEDLSVVVASNLNADILSDLGSALAGSLGLAASANLNPERRFPSMFEPVHGSAPDIAGQGIANPVGTISSGALMLRHLGLAAEADRLEAVVAEVTGAGVRTRDIGGTATTAEVTDAIVAALQQTLQPA